MPITHTVRMIIRGTSSDDSPGGSTAKIITDIVRMKIRETFLTIQQVAAQLIKSHTQL